MRRMTTVLFVVLISSACLRSTTTISIAPDGSGTVVQETGVTPQALAMLQGVAASTNAQGGGVTELFGEEQAKKAADAMGVRFISGEPIKTGDLDGYRARFAFDDIRKVQMKLAQDPTAAISPGSDTATEPPFEFAFEQRASSSVLTITVPDQTPGAGGPLGSLSGGMPGGAGGDAQMNQQGLQMMRMMMQGLFVDVSLSVDGRIVNTNAPHVDGSRVTLLQIDFDRLAADEAAWQKLQAAPDLKALSVIPGLKVIADRKVTIEFAR